VWEPDTTTARNAGNVVAHSSRDVPNSIVDVIVARRSLVEHDPQAVQQVVDAYYRYLDGLLTDRAALTRLIAEDADLDTGQATSVVEGIRLYGTQEADAFMNRDLFPLDEPQVRQSIKAIGSLLALDDPSLVLDDRMVDGSFVARTARR
jgi:ABC-type nitrate/sulfonate/bicarbonate transport system substrate-binding protein